MQECKIKELRIVNFRSIKDDTFEFRPLTIFTGKNGSGKSTVLNALFFCAAFKNTHQINMHQFNIPDFEQDRNLSINKDKIEIYVNNQRNISCDFKMCEMQQDFDFDENLYYLNADRTPIESMKLIKNTYFKFGRSGEYVEQYFFKNSRSKISNFNDLEFKTLDMHISFWLEKILNLRFEFTTKETQQRIQCDFHSNELNADIDPTRIATGMNYLTKILIVGLTCKKGDVFIVENPEIHLHPKAISNLTDFFAMLACGGVQVVLETHDTRLVSKLRILTHNKSISSNDAIIYYKDSIESEFQKVFINESGFFINAKKKKIPFPQGFMDVNLEELMDIR